MADTTDVRLGEGEADETGTTKIRVYADRLVSLNEAGDQTGIKRLPGKLDRSGHFLNLQLISPKRGSQTLKQDEREPSKPNRDIALLAFKVFADDLKRWDDEKLHELHVTQGAADSGKDGVWRGADSSAFIANHPKWNTKDAKESEVVGYPIDKPVYWFYMDDYHDSAAVAQGLLRAFGSPDEYFEFDVKPAGSRDNTSSHDKQVEEFARLVREFVDMADWAARPENRKKDSQDSDWLLIDEGALQQYIEENKLSTIEKADDWASLPSFDLPKGKRIHYFPYDVINLLGSGKKGRKDQQRFPIGRRHPYIYYEDLFLFYNREEKTITIEKKVGDTPEAPSSWKTMSKEWQLAEGNGIDTVSEEIAERFVELMDNENNTASDEAYIEEFTSFVHEFIEVADYCFKELTGENKIADQVKQYIKSHNYMYLKGNNSRIIETTKDPVKIGPYPFAYQFTDRNGQAPVPSIFPQWTTPNLFYSAKDEHLYVTASKVSSDPVVKDSSGEDIGKYLSGDGEVRDSEIRRVAEAYWRYYMKNRTNEHDKADAMDTKTYVDPMVEKLAKLLEDSKNIILRGAPGTGKTWLAQQVAMRVVFGEYVPWDGDKWTFPDEEEGAEKWERQHGFVQFHPSYDYTDFVEGLRPTTTGDGSVGFELRPGVFMSFVDEARADDAAKGIEGFTLEGYRQFLHNVGLKTVTINDYVRRINQLLGQKNWGGERELANWQQYDSLAELAEAFDEVKAFDRENDLHYIYSSAVRQLKLFADSLNSRGQSEPRGTKKYVFIIDEINRGEISKIFGELFFSIDPGYRGKKEWGVATQYANLHGDPDSKFYIPDNVYIIGTMNDIDRSVDTFDFAMRRRFEFREIRADEERQDAMFVGFVDSDVRKQVKARMDKLNKAIRKTEGLGSNYEIGPSYFLKFEGIKGADSAGFREILNRLWNNRLESLLQEYVRGMDGEEDKMKAFLEAYDPKMAKEKYPPKLEESAAPIGGNETPAVPEAVVVDEL